MQACGHAHSAPVSSQEAGYSVFKVIEEEKMFPPSITPNWRGRRIPVLVQKMKKVKEMFKKPV
jgi:hypothetical protein